MMRLNLGAGNKILKGYVNTDLKRREGIIDEIVDINKKLPFVDETFDEIRAECVLEYAKDLRFTMKEIHRISRKGARIMIDVPYKKVGYPEVCSFDENSFKIFTDGWPYVSKMSIFKVLEQELVPTCAGCFLPTPLRNYLAHYIGNLVSRVKVTMEVIK